ncbi:ent-copalyl diphosphate synthase 1-like isoform X2 [Prosopis cineraria]|uniref:ent-copalyl diphosphate synthase 1-like isoform X2 n=1 Tax=Prosopis cineraria TaxID=364024 RepID=UPI00240F23FE|nr:ent-copalyl diphosphate synthase 1-like isoform X2 [Prosopis cineraria]
MLSSHYMYHHQYHFNNQSHSSLPSSTHHMLSSSSSSSIDSVPIHPCFQFHGVSELKARATLRCKISDLKAKCSSGISHQITDVVLKEKDSALDDRKEQKAALEAYVRKEEIRKRVEAIRWTLESEEGEESLSVSAYNTAWLGLIENENGDGSPQFPSCLEWIIHNQFPDGSWGDPHLFLLYDRLLSTLACVIALRRWDLHPDIAAKGLKFFNENVNKLETEEPEHMPCGYEIVLPTLLQLAKSSNIDVPLHSPALKGIFARRDEKLKRIPMEVFHNVPTTILFSLEAIPGAQWENLMKLQYEDGSFLFSPSATAYAYMHTKDQNCLNYLKNVVRQFNGKAPEFYPLDFFERLWVVDRLDRLGISRYFQRNITDMLDYVQRNRKEDGIGWTRFSNLPDLDETSMGFRLLRLNGYEVSADIFKNFEKDGEFFCYRGQTDQGTTDTYNLYRACQVQFPGEQILEVAKNFTTKLLTEQRAANQILDKWVLLKDLPGEVGYALDFPWYASLPRVETRFYLEQYGGGDDIWVSKTYYRFRKVSNDTNLELGTLDYNMCQAVHQAEWKTIQKWHSECGLEELGLSRERLLLLYFLAAASIFEPERSKERLAWFKTSALMETIKSNYCDPQQRKAFVQEFSFSSNSLNGRCLNKSKNREGLLGILLDTLLSFSQASSTATFNILHNTWEKWLSGSQSEGDEWEGEAELLVKMINLNGGFEISQDIEVNPIHQRLVQLSNELCLQLTSLQENKIYEEGNSNGRCNKDRSGLSEPEIALKMQELVQLVLSSNGIDSNLKKTFLTVTKAFYYTAHCNPNTISSHVNKVLFERVII